MLLVGFLLVAGLGMIGVEAVGFSRGGYNSEFWRLPLDDKLDHVSEHRWEWWWVSIWGLVGLFLATGGLAGFIYLLADAGEPILAFVAIGFYLVALFAWVFGLITQASATSQAASQRTETGETPAWIHPFWQAGYFAEGTWIIGSNLAYAILGIGVLQSGMIGGWAGWSAVGIGLLIPIIVLATRVGFPQLGLIVPFVLGVATLIEHF